MTGKGFNAILSYSQSHSRTLKITQTILSPMKNLRKLSPRISSSKLSAFTLIELLVVISIIAVLAAVTLSNVPGILAKGQITGVVGNYHNMFISTQNASMDMQNAGGTGAFPGDLTNATVSAWSNTLVPAYLTGSQFKSMLAIKGQITNTVVYNVGATNDSTTVFLACANLSSNAVGLGGPFGKYGGAYITLSGQGVTINGTNPAAVSQLTNSIWTTAASQ